MGSEKESRQLPVYAAQPEHVQSLYLWRRRALRATAAFSTLLFLAYTWNPAHICLNANPTPASAVAWTPCGDNFQCANISLPLDYHNASDPRTVSIAVTRYLATNTTYREGTVFINPGGPGGSGTAMAYNKGPYMSEVFKGRYDILGFDPRGVNLTRPYVSCFESKLAEDVFRVQAQGFQLNLPVNVTKEVRDDLAGQVGRTAAWMEALAGHCAKRVGEEMAYFGTEFVARDIDAMSKIIEGEDKRVNYWGFSYGTILGQYLIKVLPPARLGRVIIDGVVNPDIWVDYSPRSFGGYFIDVDNVLASFATSCAASPACALSSLTPNSILAQIDSLIDSLYYHPQPVTDLDVPAVATAQNARALVFEAMYKIQAWTELAEHLDNAFKGNLSGVVRKTALDVDGAGASKRDYSTYVTNTIRCTDAKPYAAKEDVPSNEEIEEYVLESMRKYSGRMGDQFFSWSFCHLWEGIEPRRSRYEGTFEMANDTLDTPILVLSNKYDPVTPLANAFTAQARLGNNARLIEQVDGWGHCALAHKSFCTAEIVSAYMVNGVLPAEGYTECKVVEKPFAPFDEQQVLGLMSGNEGDEGVRRAWVRLSDVW